MAQISISTTFDYKVPLSEQLPMIRKAGFTHVSFGMDYSHSGLLREANFTSPILMEVGVENSKYKDPEELVQRAHDAAEGFWNEVHEELSENA